MMNQVVARLYIMVNDQSCCALPLGSSAHLCHLISHEQKTVDTESKRQ